MCRTGLGRQRGKVKGGMKEKGKSVYRVKNEGEREEFTYEWWVLCRVVKRERKGES